jgi:hypothetical protein
VTPEQVVALLSLLADLQRANQALIQENAQLRATQAAAPAEETPRV